MGSLLLPAHAVGVHKWVDTKGVTHYSDEAPESSTTQVTLIEVLENYSVSVDAENDYYSIAHQWMRMHEESIEQEKIKLEKAKQKAAQKSSQPEIVTVIDSGEKRYVVALPGFSHGKHGHRRGFHEKSKYYAGYLLAKRQRGGPLGKSYRARIRSASYIHRRTNGSTFKIR